MRYLLFCVLTLFALVGQGAGTPAVGTGSQSLSRAEQILEHVKVADIFCGSIALADKVTVQSGKITERPVVLCALKESDQSWHAVEVRLAYPVKQEYISCVAQASTLDDRTQCTLPMRVVTQGYRVTHLGGTGVTRLIFDVFLGDEKLTVYRTRHFWFDDAALAEGDADKIIQTATPINYTPYHPDFRDDELVRRGRNFLRQEIDVAMSDLRSVSVYSRAFPSVLVSDVVTKETTEGLAVIEQMDDKKYLADPTGTVHSVFIEYALNGKEAFRWTQSSAHAIGPYQFTDAGGGGTYSFIVREYAEAGLTTSFSDGARDLRNAIKAAILLIDFEVAQFPAIQKIYRSAPTRGAIYPVAAYNCGPSCAKLLHAWLTRNRMSVLKGNVRLPREFVTITRACPCRVEIRKDKNGKTYKHTVETVTKKVNTETPGYLEKYLYFIRNFIETPVSLKRKTK